MRAQLALDGGGHNEKKNQFHSEKKTCEDELKHVHVCDPANHEELVRSFASRPYFARASATWFGKLIRHVAYRAATHRNELPQVTVPCNPTVRGKNRKTARVGEARQPE